MIDKDLVNTIKKHEGLQLKPYKCPTGFLTIGYGRNLETNGITQQEAELLLLNDIEYVDKQLQKQLHIYNVMPITIQHVLINMAFQIGVDGLLKFKKTLAYLAEKNYKDAAKEMLNSKWAQQTPNRARELANIVSKYGEYK